MPIDGSPKNGDYASYIEEISNRKGGAPAALAHMGATANSGLASIANDDTWSRQASPAGWSSQPSPPADPLGGTIPWGRSSATNTVSSFPPPSPNPVPAASDPTNMFTKSGAATNDTAATFDPATMSASFRVLGGALFGLILIIWLVVAFFKGTVMQASTIFPAVILFIIARGLYTSGVRRMHAAATNAPYLN